jgi:hypothetical protein
MEKVILSRQIRPLTSFVYKTNQRFYNQEYTLHYSRIRRFVVFVVLLIAFFGVVSYVEDVEELPIVIPEIILSAFEDAPLTSVFITVIGIYIVATVSVSSVSLSYMLYLNNEGSRIKIGGQHIHTKVWIFAFPIAYMTSKNIRIEKDAFCKKQANIFTGLEDFNFSIPATATAYQSNNQSLVSIVFNKMESKGSLAIQDPSVIDIIEEISIEDLERGLDTLNKVREEDYKNNKKIWIQIRQGFGMRGVQVKDIPLPEMYFPPQPYINPTSESGVTKSILSSHTKEVLEPIVSSKNTAKTQKLTFITGGKPNKTNAFAEASA